MSKKQKTIESILIFDLLFMCLYEKQFMNDEGKLICEKFMDNDIVTEDLLKLYCEKELESWGDARMGEIITFIYENFIIKGKCINENYPVKILSVIQK